MLTRSEHVLDPDREHEDEVENILRSVEEVSDVASVLGELTNTKVNFTLPESPLSSVNEVSSSADAPSVTN
jgi:chemotaxis protein CheY-P-specific phosphatase CheC